MWCSTKAEHFPNDRVWGREHEHNKSANSWVIVLSVFSHWTAVSFVYFREFRHSHRPRDPLFTFIQLEQAKNVNGCHTSQPLHHDCLISLILFRFTRLPNNMLWSWIFRFKFLILVGHPFPCEIQIWIWIIYGVFYGRGRWFSFVCLFFLPFLIKSRIEQTVNDAYEPLKEYNWKIVELIQDCKFINDFWMQRFVLCIAKHLIRLSWTWATAIFCIIINLTFARFFAIAIFTYAKFGRARKEAVARHWHCSRNEFMAFLIASP